MSHHVSDKIWLIGAGNMAVEYAKILHAQGVPFEVIGRNTNSAMIFTQKTGVPVNIGGLSEQLKKDIKIPLTAIVAVGAEALADVTIQLLRHGVKRILVEKPAGLNLSQIKQVAGTAEKYAAKVFVAYNRRFYASVLKAKEIIDDDGGVSSFNFEFTEWSHAIAPLKKAVGVKEAWFLANSTHVVDLAFYLGGKPKAMSCFTSGGVGWHPSASVFSGAGVTDTGALFSYQANWEAPGRWGAEFLTRKHRLILRPLEQLYIQHLGSTAVEKAELEDVLDVQFKPGLYCQVEAVLGNINQQALLDIHEQLKMVCDHYDRISSEDLKS